MKQSNQVIELNHKASELYNIVLDIERYPDYIPWCSNIEILNRQKNQMKADMIVNYKFFPSQKFTSNVFFNNKKLLIKTEYVNGQLKDLDTTWEFKDIKNNKSKVLFSVGFEFQNMIHQKLAEFFFPLIENKMVNSFIKRADEILN